MNPGGAAGTAGTGMAVAVPAAAASSPAVAVSNPAVEPPTTLPRRLFRTDAVPQEVGELLAEGFRGLGVVVIPSVLLRLSQIGG
ncbi:hypothetical protein NS07_v2contig00092-0011 [Nocardia seriolae]|nr:hypothetical protein NSER024013_38440 [Nocardia seriolae]GAM48954.1 hypothetical protein NS07_v2contig00092-0011 [Nocardia seriolae]